MNKKNVDQKTVGKKKTLLFSPKKKLGQNFIFDHNYLSRMVDAFPITNKTVIIEVGSGYGNLTNQLAERDCYKIISFEKDSRLIEWLSNNNKYPEKVTFLHQDVLLTNWTQFCLPYDGYPTIVVGNLPYYLANTLIIELLFNQQLFSYLAFLVQKEVAQRWISLSCTAISVFINYLSATRIVTLVPSTVFVPKPSVDGALVEIKISDKNVPRLKIRSFWKFLRNCFRSRRKTLLNNLFGFCGNDRSCWINYWKEHQYSTNLRPHQFFPNDYWRFFLFWSSLLEKNSRTGKKY